MTLGHHRAGRGQARRRHLRHRWRLGYNATAIMDGVTKAFIGGAVSTLGYPLKIANSGWLVAASSGDVYVARALAIGGSGDLLEVAVD